MSHRDNQQGTGIVIVVINHICITAKANEVSNVRDLMAIETAKSAHTEGHSANSRQLERRGANAKAINGISKVACRGSTHRAIQR